MLALSSFLDTFQKIADAASNTKGKKKQLGDQIVVDNSVLVNDHSSSHKSETKTKWEDMWQTGVVLV